MRVAGEIYNPMARFIILIGMIYSLFSCQTDSKSVSNQNLQDSDSLRPMVLDTAMYIGKGNQIVKATFDTLSAALKTTIATQGIEGALKYCNVAAFPITNLYATSNKAMVKRISLKNRNDNNKPDSLGTRMLTLYENEKSKAQILKEKIVFDGEAIHYFKPILVQALCLNCHGQVGKTLNAKNYAVITKLYPNDKAVDYQLNELRGAWQITFRKN
jgi:hypothetical protein